MQIARPLNLMTLTTSGVIASFLMSTDVHAASNGIIAYSCRGSDFHQQICFINQNGSGKVQITSGNDNGLPSWSPTGKTLAYTNFQADPTTHMPVFRIMVMNTFDRRPKIISPGVWPSWSRSPDRNKIAFAKPSSSDPRTAEIWAMDPDGTHQQQLTNTPGLNKQGATWSPDGKSLAYTQSEFVEGRQRTSVWVLTVDAPLGGTNPHELTTGTCPPNNDPCDNVDADGHVINTATDAGVPAWSPKGNQIILGVKYVNPIIFWSGVQGDRGQIWIIDADGNNRTQLTMPTKPPPGEPYPNNDDPEWSADGTLILFSTNRNDGKPEMWRMRADGSGQQRIVNNTFGPLPGNAAWQPVP